MYGRKVKLRFFFVLLTLLTIILSIFLILKSLEENVVYFQSTTDIKVLAEVDKKKHVSRITIVTIGTPQVIEQIKLQLKKLIPVHKVADFSRHDPNILFKELALFKIVANSKKQDKAKKICKKLLREKK